MAADIGPVRSRNALPATVKLRPLTLDHIDGRCRAARRTRERLTALEAEAGGADTLSASEYEALRHAAVIGTVLEDLEARLLAGEASIDPLALATLNNTLRRALEAAGLRRDSPNDDARLIENYRAVANAKASEAA
jgi:hypothetical protein